MEKHITSITGYKYLKVRFLGYYQYTIPLKQHLIYDSDTTEMVIIAGYKFSFYGLVVNL